MSAFGQTTAFETLGNDYQVSADGVPEYKVGGLTIDWSLVTAVVTTAKTLRGSGRIVAIGDKYLPAGIVLTRITTGGKFAFYDSGASDGRQTLTRGDCYILNNDILQSENPDGLINSVFDGGLVYIERVIDLTGPAQSNPTFDSRPSRANVLTAFPRLRILNAAG